MSIDSCWDEVTIIADRVTIREDGCHPIPDRVTIGKDWPDPVRWGFR